MKKYSGGCHCGAIRFEMETDLKKAVRCNCSLCRKKGALMHRVKPEQFKILQGENDLVLYQFNTHIAKHFFCRRCGIYTHHHPRSAPDLIAVNLNCLDDDVDESGLEIICFDGKKWDTTTLQKINECCEPSAVKKSDAFAEWDNPKDAEYDKL